MSGAAGLSPLPSGSFVYRALGSAKCINKDTSEILPQTFLRRQADANGLSVATSPERSIRDLTSWHGIVRLHVGLIRGVGLEVVLDSPDHGNIDHSIPYASTDLSGKAESIAGDLARISTLVAPKGRKPS